jgi:hypothetical protein
MTPTALLALSLTLGAPPADREPQKHAEELVAQLGAPAYRDRELAAKELLELGYAAKNAVLAGQKSSDGEISERCRKLYPAILRHDLEKRIAKFLDNTDGLVTDDLPGAARWIKIAGDGQESRELYAEMVKAHSELLLQVELEPRQIQQAYAEFLCDVYRRVYPRTVGGATARQGPTETEVLIFLFLGAAGDVRTTIIPGTNSSHYYQFLNAPFMVNKLSASPPATAFRKLYAAWLEKERYTLVLRRGLDIAATNAVKECAPTALKIAGDPGTLATIRATALIGFGKLASKEDIKELAPFLADKTQIANVVVNGQRGTVQMRDVAMGAAVQLAGQKLADFGFERAPPGGHVSISTYTYFAFGTDEKRDAAHAKWKEWATKNLPKE